MLTITPWIFISFPCFYFLFFVLFFSFFLQYFIRFEINLLRNVLIQYSTVVVVTIAFLPSYLLLGHVYLKCCWYFLAVSRFVFKLINLYVIGNILSFNKIFLLYLNKENNIEKLFLINLRIIHYTIIVVLCSTIVKHIGKT